MVYRISDIDFTILSFYVLHSAMNKENETEQKVGQKSSKS